MLDEDYLSSLEKTHPTLLARTPTGTWSGGFGMPQFRIICLRLLVCACVCVLAPGRFVVGILGPHSPSFALRCPKLVPLVLWNKTSHETLQPTKIWGQPWFNHPSWCGDYTPQIEIEMGPVYEPKLEVLCMNHSFGGSKWKKNIPNSNIFKSDQQVWISGSWVQSKKADGLGCVWGCSSCFPRTFHILGVAGVDSLSIVHPTGTPPNLGMGLIEILGHSYEQYHPRVPGVTPNSTNQQKYIYRGFPIATFDYQRVYY